MKLPPSIEDIEFVGGADFSNGSLFQITASKALKVQTFCKTFELG